MDKKQDYIRLREKVADLEEKVEHLRFSRRVLMNLLEKMIHERTSYQPRQNRKIRTIIYKKK